MKFSDRCSVLFIYFLTWHYMHACEVPPLADPVDNGIPRVPALVSHRWLAVNNALSSSGTGGIWLSNSTLNSGPGRVCMTRGTHASHCNVALFIFSPELQLVPVTVNGNGGAAITTNYVTV